MATDVIRRKAAIQWSYPPGRRMSSKHSPVPGYAPWLIPDRMLELPTDKALNVHLTVDASGLGYSSQAHDIVRVEHMELTGATANWKSTSPGRKNLLLPMPWPGWQRCFTNFRKSTGCRRKCQETIPHIIPARSALIRG